MENVSEVVRQVTEQRERVLTSLSRIRRKVAIMSGKGGVGKSTVAANLAIALGRAGFRVGLLDADLDGPSVPRLLGIGGQRLVVEAGRVMPAQAMYDLRVASLALLLSNEEAAVAWEGPTQAAYAWRGAMAMSATRELIADVDWGELELLLVDLPPGAEQLHNLVDLVPDLMGAIVVTTPSDVAELTVRRSVAYARRLGVRLIGLVRNMDGLVCPHCGVVVDLFSGGQAQELAPDWGIPVVARIPFDPSLQRRPEEQSLDSDPFAGSTVAEAFRRMGEVMAGLLELESPSGSQEDRQ